VTGDINLYGVFVPPLLAMVVATLPLAALLRFGLTRAGAYRFVWHRPLFDVALFVILLGATFSVVQSGVFR
jgi:hypothetical protein